MRYGVIEYVYEYIIHFLFSLSLFFFIFIFAFSVSETNALCFISTSGTNFFQRDITGKQKFPLALCFFADERQKSKRFLYV